MYNINVQAFKRGKLQGSVTIATAKNIGAANQQHHLANTSGFPEHTAAVNAMRELKKAVPEGCRFAVVICEV